MSLYFEKLSKSNCLEKLNLQLLDKANQSDLLDCETTAIDASILKSYERAKPKS